LPQTIIFTRTVTSATFVAFATVLILYLGPIEKIVETPLPVLSIIYGVTGSKLVANALVFTYTVDVCMCS
jgi:hypothetical protein